MAVLESRSKVNRILTGRLWQKLVETLPIASSVDTDKAFVSREKPLDQANRIRYSAENKDLLGIVIRNMETKPFFERYH